MRKPQIAFILLFFLLLQHFTSIFILRYQVLFEPEKAEHEEIVFQSWNAATSGNRIISELDNWYNEEEFSMLFFPYFDDRLGVYGKLEADYLVDEKISDEALQQFNRGFEDGIPSVLVKKNSDWVYRINKENSTLTINDEVFKVVGFFETTIEDSSQQVDLDVNLIHTFTPLNLSAGEYEVYGVDQEGIGQLFSEFVVQGNEIAINAELDKQSSLFFNLINDSFLQPMLIILDIAFFNLFIILFVSFRSESNKYVIHSLSGATKNKYILKDYLHKLPVLILITCSGNILYHFIIQSTPLKIGPSFSYYLLMSVFFFIFISISLIGTHYVALSFLHRKGEGDK